MQIEQDLEKVEVNIMNGGLWVFSHFWNDLMSLLYFKPIPFLPIY